MKQLFRHEKQEIDHSPKSPAPQRRIPGLTTSLNVKRPHPQEHVYLDLLSKVYLEGLEREDRTGVGTRSLFGAQLRFNLQDSFPLITTRKIPFKAVKTELLWFLTGNTNIEFLHQHGVKIWDPWLKKDGSLGPIYGAQWRSWPTPDGKKIDQIQWVINEIKTNPFSRRLIVSAWNPADIEKMALPPCHTLFQFYVHSGSLSCHLYQRAADMLIGLPFNIASYSLLVHLIAQVCNLRPGELVHSIGDAHIYKNHLEATKVILSRQPNEGPTLKLNPKINDIFSFTANDISVENYNPLPKISLDVAI